MFLKTTLISILQLHYQAFNEPQYTVSFYVKNVIRTCLVFYLKESEVDPLLQFLRQALEIA